MPTHLSNSALTTWQHCGEAYRLERIEKVSVPPAWYFVGGSAVHTATENLDLLDFGVQVNGPTSFNDALDAEIAKREEETGFPRVEWTRSGKATKEYPNKEDESWWRANGPGLVRSYRLWVEKGPWRIWIEPESGLPAIEIEVNYEAAGVPVKGFADRIFEHVLSWDLMVLDIKNGSSEPKDNRQLTGYRMGLKELGDVRYGSYFMTRKAQLLGPYDLAGTEAGLAHQYAEAWRGIEAEVFPVRIDRHCGWCRVKKHCHAMGGQEAQSILPFSPDVMMGPQEETA